MEAIVLATLAGTWASFIISLVVQRLVVWPFVITLLICLSAGWWYARPRLEKEWLFWLTVIGWGVFLVKLFSQMLVIDSEGIWAGGSNVWGDWAGHMGYIANWLYGSNWPPQNPWYAGIRLSYPFLFDFTSAILVKLGVSLPWSFQLPGIVFSLAI